jgi:NADH:ubiquinone oxidoreductase subunit
MKAFTNILKKAKSIMRAHEDAKLNRRLVGRDRYNNTYFQYYDEEGNETKRACEYTSKHVSEEDIDPYWNAWLKKVQREPPSPELLKEFYEAEEKFKQNAYEYEKKDAEMMKNYRMSQEKKSESDRPNTEQSKGQGPKFEPGAWKPGKK